MQSRLVSNWQCRCSEGGDTRTDPKPDLADGSRGSQSFFLRFSMHWCIAYTLLQYITHASPSLEHEGWSKLKSFIQQPSTLNCPDSACSNMCNISLQDKHMCNRCECRKCSACGMPMQKWSSPSGQIIHSFVTRTEPSFTFAYNPADSDMDRMLQHFVVEPGLTLAWYTTHTHASLTVAR